MSILLRLASALSLAVIAVVTPFEGQARAFTPPVTATIFSSSVTAHKLVAVTFDDGPSPYTAGVLDILRRNRVPATFFLVGYRIPRFRAETRQVMHYGHLLGNHTYSHADLQWLSSAGVAGQIARAQDEIRRATGITSHWFRPPYGAVDPRIAALAAVQQLHTATWSVDPRDWSRPGVEAIVSRVLTAVRPRSIVLMHDGGGNRSETLAALAQLIPILKERGYRFITLDEMFFPQESQRLT